MRLRPLLPGQQAGGHCERAGLTKSTSFPRAVRKGIGGVLEPMKEDCSNKISVQEKEGRWTSEQRTGKENAQERAMRGHSYTGGGGGGGGRLERALALLLWRFFQSLKSFLMQPF